MEQQAPTAKTQGPRPLPAPPTSPQQPAASARPSYPSNYAPSSSTNPPPRLNAHEALYGAQPEPLDWLSSQQGGPMSSGSTFFVAASQRLGGPSTIPGMAFPQQQDARSFAGREQPHQRPAFNQQTSYSPPRSPQQLPAGARPLPSPPQQRPLPPSSPRPQQAFTQPQGGAANAPVTKIPLATSSSILLHSGFWQILSASGSRFLTSAPSPAVVAPQFPPGFGDDIGFFHQQPSRPPPQQERRTQTAPAPMQGGAARQQDLKKKKRVSVDMVGKPQGFQ